MRTRYFAALALAWLAIWPARADEPRDSLVGQLLIATEDMRDPRFAETVILIVRDDDTGTLGLVLNRPIGEGSLADLHRQLGLPDAGPDAAIVLHAGGPVQPGVGFVVHDREFEAEDTMHVPGGFGVSRLRPVLSARADGRGPSQAIYTFGYAGWSPGQLTAELAREDWEWVAADPRLVFETPPVRMWQRARQRRGVDL